MRCRFLPYGIDAPYVIRNLLLTGMLLIGLSLYLQHVMINANAWLTGLVALLMMASYSLLYTAGLMLFSSVWGKRRLYQKLLSLVHYDPKATVVDLGCGSGLLLTLVAKPLTTGFAIGLDIWSSKDQSNNSIKHTQTNLAQAEVRDRVMLLTGDMQSIALATASVDLVISSMAIHNVSKKNCQQVIAELVRVLKPGGQFALLDFRYTDLYQQSLVAAGCAQVKCTRRYFMMCPPVRMVYGCK